MADRKAIELMKSLTKIEKGEFKKWIKSPFFNIREDVMSLSDYLMLFIKEDDKKQAELKGIKNADLFVALKEEYKKWRIAQLSDEKIWQVVKAEEKKTLPDKEKDTKIRFIFFTLAENLENYLIHKQISEEQNEKSKLLATALKAKKLIHLFDRAIEDWDKKISEESTINAEYAKQQYTKLKLLSDKQQIYNRDNIYLQEVSDHFINYSFAAFFHQYVSMLHHQRVKEIEYDYDFLEKIMEILKKQTKYHTPSNQLRLLALDLLANTTEESIFFHFKTILFDIEEKLSFRENQDFHKIAINYCIKRANQGVEVFKKEAFEFGVKSIEKSYSLDNEILTPNSFINIIRLGLEVLRIGALKEWNALDFIEKNIILLPESKQREYYNFALTYYYYKTAQYEAALNILLLDIPQDVIHACDARRMGVIIYFEINKFDLLDNSLNLLTQYIRNHQAIPEVFKNSNLNFISFMKEMIAWQNMAKKNRRIFVSDLMERIKNTPSLGERSWFLSKLENIV